MSTLAGGWDNTKSIVRIQFGGSGNPIQFVDFSDMNTAQLSGPSGGGQDVETRWARDFSRNGLTVPVGVVKSSDRSRITADLSIREKIARLVEYFEFKHNLLVSTGYADALDPTDFAKMIALVDCYGTDQSHDNPLAKGTSDVMDDIMRVFPVSASERVEVFPVNFENISSTPTANPFKKVISFGFRRGPNALTGEGVSDGNQDFLAVTGTSGAGTVPTLQRTRNGGSSWTAMSLTTFTDAVAAGLCLAGSNVVIALQNGVGALGGVVYALKKDVLRTTPTPTFVRSTGIAAGTAVNAVATVNGVNVYAVGDTGKIWFSSDEGKSFTLVHDGLVTTQNLTEIAVASEALIWFAGAAGAVVKLLNGAFSLVTVSGLAAAVNAIRVPPMRTLELYIAAADGKLRRTRNQGDDFAEVTFDQSGTGNVDDVQFSGGPDGLVMWFLQRDGSSKTRVMRDLSGGACSAVQVVGSFTSPLNGQANSIAVTDANHGLVVGEIVSAKALTGRISARAASS